MQSRTDSYGHTNQTDASYIWRTNLVTAGGTIATVMRLDSSLFKNRGYLVATTNRDVFWVDRDGYAHAMTAE